jgi:hypothetical protein
MRIKGKRIQKKSGVDKINSLISKKLDCEKFGLLCGYLSEYFIIPPMHKIMDFINDLENKDFDKMKKIRSIKIKKDFTLYKMKKIFSIIVNSPYLRNYEQSIDGFLIYYFCIYKRFDPDEIKQLLNSSLDRTSWFIVLLKKNYVFTDNSQIKYLKNYGPQIKYVYDKISNYIQFEELVIWLNTILFNINTIVKNQVNDNFEYIYRDIIFNKSYSKEQIEIFLFLPNLLGLDNKYRYYFWTKNYNSMKQIFIDMKKKNILPNVISDHFLHYHSYIILQLFFQNGYVLNQNEFKLILKNSSGEQFVRQKNYHSANLEFIQIIELLCESSITYNNRIVNKYNYASVRNNYILDNNFVLTNNRDVGGINLYDEDNFYFEDFGLMTEDTYYYHNKTFDDNDPEEKYLKYYDKKFIGIENIIPDHHSQCYETDMFHSKSWPYTKNENKFILNVNCKPITFTKFIRNIFNYHEMNQGYLESLCLNYTTNYFRIHYDINLIKKSSKFKKT